MNPNKKVLIGIVVLVCVLFVLYAVVPLIISFFQQSHGDQCTFNGQCVHEAQLSSLTESLPLFISFGIIVGAIAYYFMAHKLESKEKNLRGTTDILLKFLNKEERLIVDRLIKEEGKCLQSEISRIEGIGKLKSHRVLQRLSDRGIIEIEGHGKTNIIRFKKEIKEGLGK